MSLTMRPNPRLCPQCRSRLVRRSRRLGFVEVFIFPLLTLRPYRCEECYLRYAGSILASRRRPWVGFRAQAVRALKFSGLALLLWATAIGADLVDRARLGMATGLKPRAPFAGSTVLPTPNASVPAATAYARMLPEPFTGSPAGAVWLARAAASGPMEWQLTRETVGALQVTGQAYVGDQPVAGETTVFVGDSVRTAAGATGTLRLPEEGILTIGSDAQIDFVDEEQYAAVLQRGTIGFRVFGAVKRSRMRVGRFVVVSVPGQTTTGAVTVGKDGAIHFVCSAGSFGVIDMERSDSVFLTAGEEADLSPEGQIVKQTPQRTAGPPPEPPVKEAGGGGGRVAAVVLGVGGAAGAVAALTLGKKDNAVSPSVP